VIVHVTGWPFYDRQVIAMVADDTGINVGFKLFVIAVDGYAAVNSLSPWIHSVVL